MLTNWPSEKPPQHQWTLEELGDSSGMSRATLVRQFKETIGVTPMTYLSNWRMNKAYHYVEYSTMSLNKIADVIGLSSSRTLTKAFTRHYGYTPPTNYAKTLALLSEIAAVKNPNLRRTCVVISHYYGLIHP
jgi:AraC-like DNA-binding protein